MVLFKILIQTEKSKRHTEHVHVQHEINLRELTTPLICTSNTHQKVRSVSSFLDFKINNQIKCCCVWSFFERNVFCVHYWWGKRERRKMFPKDCGFVPSARKRQRNTNLFHLLLSRYIFSSPLFQSAPVLTSTDQPVASPAGSSNKDHLNIHIYAKSTL